MKDGDGAATTKKQCDDNVVVVAVVGGGGGEEMRKMGLVCTLMLSHNLYLIQISLLYKLL